jgi:hypothetical protein
MLRDLYDAGVKMEHIAMALEMPDGSTLRRIKAGPGAKYKIRCSGRNVVQHWRLVEAIIALHKAICVE